MQANQMVAEMGRVNPAARNPEQEVERIAAEIDRDGFAMIRNVFDRETVERARIEVEQLIDGPYGPENLGFPEQTLHLALPGKSKTFDQMLEHILTDPVTSGVLKRCGGVNLKIRDINGRRMNGAINLGDQFN